jgi:DNA-binding transcriptional regulator YiaG
MTTPQKIQAARQRLGENTRVFAARFNVSSRTVEDWEQGRFPPNRWVWPQLDKLIAATLRGAGARRAAAK